MRRWTPWLGALSGLLLLGSVLYLSGSAWLPDLRRGTGIPGSQEERQRQARAEQASGGHGEEHAGHADEVSIELSAQALKNIGYRPVMVELGVYTRQIDVPAMVVERPGHTQIRISAPLTGVVTKIFPVEGAAVAENSPLFELRLTHEELVAAQSNLIRLAENLEVVNREIARLEGLSEGIVAGKRIIEQQYEQHKLEASLRAERQALLLHGLSPSQVEGILQTRELFQLLTVRAPEHAQESEACQDEHFFHLQSLSVRAGQQVQAGEVLGVLADHCELYIEGRAFEDDASKLRQAARNNWPISASLLVGDDESDRIDGLKLLYLADQVDPLSRVLRFYLALPNAVALEQSSPEGDLFVEWRFKPGQRMELHVPVGYWEDRMVLPVDAVVDEGAESYVFRKVGNRFQRVPVEVEHRDRSSVVISGKGALIPGQIVVSQGAYEMHLALKNQIGSGVDPHPGHTH